MGRGDGGLVQTGDIFDRGPKVREALDLLMRLEDEARRARRPGRVPARQPRGDEPPARVQGRRAGRLCRVRRRQVGGAAAAGVRRLRQGGQAPRDARRGRAGRDAWLASHPPGFLEYVDALGPRGKYGRWLRSHKVVADGRRDGLHARGRPPGHAAARSTTSTAPRRGRSPRGTTPSGDGQGADRPAVLHAPRGRRGRGGRAAADLGGTPGERAAGRSRHARVRRAAAGAPRRRQVVACSSLRARSGSAGSRLARHARRAATRRSRRSCRRFGVERFVTGHTPSQRAGSCRGSTIASS